MSFKKLTNSALIAVLVVLALVAIPYAPIQISRLDAQANPVVTLTQTTLSAAVTAATNIIPVTSATGFTAPATGAVGFRVVVMTAGQVEAMDVVSVSSTNITVTRGIAGTKRYAHASGDVVFVQRPAVFGTDPNPGIGRPPTGTCVSTTTGTGASAVITSTTTSTPYISLPSGDTFYCAGGATGQWFRTNRNGFAVGIEGSAHAIAYTVAGAIAPVCGLHTIGTAGALAMTIAPPTKDLDGCILEITATTAQAHTVTYTAGFSQTTTSSDVATFGGAVNDGFVIYADGGVWRVLSTRNVTIA